MDVIKQNNIIRIVTSIFTVSNIITNQNRLTFRISDTKFACKFILLIQKLEKEHAVCRLRKINDELCLLVNECKPSVPKSIKFWSKSWTPRFLFVVVTILVMIDGYYKTAEINSYIYIGEPMYIASIYTISLLGILGTHELGHLVVAKMHGLKTTWPYFIPGIPIFGIPTFGAFIKSTSLTINRKILFDVALAGPIAGLVITIIVLIYGIYTAPVLNNESIDLFSEYRIIEIEENFIMSIIFDIFRNDTDRILMTPILFASWLGFLITFLNLLPAWQLDGGHIARSILGNKIHKIITYVSIAILFMMGYFVMGIFILLLYSLNPNIDILDDVSQLPSNRKIIYIMIIILIVACAPIQNIHLFQ